MLARMAIERSPLSMIGFAFLAKMMQAFLVLPAFALVYMVAAPTGLRRRLGQVLAGAVAIVLSAGWWVAIVALWPASSRPFIDGSPDNSILNLITGYNGLGRIFGSSGPGGGGGGANFSGPTGLLRLFNSEMGAQSSWLLPAALIALVAGGWITRRAPRTDRTRAALMLWGGWLVVSGLVFSLGSGVIHTYYTVALAPAIAALVAIMGRELWRSRETRAARGVAALGVLVTAGWSWVLLDRTPHWESWLLVLVPLCAALALVGLLAHPSLKRLGRGAATATAVLALTACLAGPVAYSAQTITTAHTGSTPSAGPGTSGMGFGGGAPGAARTSSATGARSAAATAGVAARSGGPGAGGTGQSVSSALVKALKSNAGSYRWVAAVSGSQSAASLELASGGEPVMGIGGFNNEGGNVSLAQFKEYVAKGEIHYYLATSNGGGAGVQTGGRASGATQPGGAAQGLPGGGTAGGPPTAGGAPGGMGSSSSSAITTWVKAHFKSVSIGGQTVYDLTQARSS